MRYFFILLVTALVACSPETRPEAETVGAGDAGSDTTSSPSHSHGVHPRWVLVNGDGEEVEAVIGEPDFTQGVGEDREVVDPTDGVNPKVETVEVRAIGDRTLGGNVNLKLETGEVFGITPEPSSSDYGVVHYETSKCEEPAYWRSPQGAWHFVLIGGDETKTYWTKGQVTERAISSVYFTDAETGKCQKGTNDRKFEMVPFQPAPDWLNEAFPNPPYTVRPAY